MTFDPGLGPDARRRYGVTWIVVVTENPPPTKRSE